MAVALNFLTLHDKYNMYTYIVSENKIYLHSLTLWEKLKVAKAIIRSHKLKDKQYNRQKKEDKRTNNDLQNTTLKTKNWGWTQVIWEGQQLLKTKNWGWTQVIREGQQLLKTKNWGWTQVIREGEQLLKSKNWGWTQVI